MLSLQLKSGDYLTIGDNIAVQIFEQSGSSFRVAVKAPREIPILRGEVHERTGTRPDGLRSRRPKSPSERAYDARHFEQWIGKRELREAELQKKAEEKAAVLRELKDLAAHVDQLVTAQGSAGLKEKLTGLCSRLEALEAEQDENTRESKSE